MKFVHFFGIFLVLLTSSSLAGYTTCTDVVNSSDTLENGQNDPLLLFRHTDHSTIYQAQGEKTFQILYKINRENPALSAFESSAVFVTFYTSSGYTLIASGDSCFLNSQGIIHAVWDDAFSSLNTTLIARIYTADNTLNRIQSFPLNRNAYAAGNLVACPQPPTTLPSIMDGAIEIDIDTNIVQTTNENYTSFYYRLSDAFNDQTNFRLTTLSSNDVEVFMPVTESGDFPNHCEKTYPRRDYQSWKFASLKFKNPPITNTSYSLTFLVAYGNNFYIKNSLKIDIRRSTFGEINSAVTSGSQPVSNYPAETSYQSAQPENTGYQGSYLYSGSSSYQGDNQYQSYPGYSESSPQSQGPSTSYTESPQSSIQQSYGTRYFH
jgi:hypothetical protein